MRRLLLVLGCLSLAACGSASSEHGAPHESPAARQVRMTVEAWLATLTTSAKKGDSARACSYLTPALQRSIDEQLRMRGETTTCKTGAAEWTGGNTPPGHLDAHVTGVRVAGARAIATLEAPPDSQSDVKLRKVGSRWLIENY